MNLPPYPVRHAAQSSFVHLRGLRYHVHTWSDATLATPARPPLVLLHGWMDVGASFQFLVDALAEAEGFERHVIAPDWRGFGRTETPGADTYWFPDYLGDLDALLDALLPATRFPAIDLLGHSMGGNVVMSYAGLRPQRIRRLINLEGFGLPATKPHHAPKRLLQWLDDLKTPQALRDYASLDEVAQRLLKNNPLLTPDKAAWLAPHWARPGADGRWHIQGDPAHKRANPVLYRVDEVLETWKAITAPLLWAEGDLTDTAKWWGHRYSKAEFHARLAVVPQVQKVMLSPCGHMLHHDQPQALAQHLRKFLA
ncbi:MAG: alpha/beta hydrolase [Rubrivivax sp.]|nr:alpha/beta hydrolase [Rubrivivax sp.]